VENEGGVSIRSAEEKKVSIGRFTVKPRLGRCNGTNRPAAKILLAFPLSTLMAVTGPGIPDPTDTHEELEKKYFATLADVPY
jgi:hypothetical protein